MGEFVTYPIPAPTGGLNLIDRLDAPEGRPMEDARKLKNIYPEGPKCSIRGGYTEHVDLDAQPVRAMFSLTLASGVSTLIACNNNKILDASSDPETNETGATTPTSNEWQGAVFKHRLYLCNGTNTVQVWDGSSVADSTFTGPTLADLINVSAYKGRIYFVKKNSTSIWYGGVGAVGGGALTEEDLEGAASAGGSILTRGGFIVYAGSWTNNIGDVSRSLFVIVTSEGEVLCYDGSYPGDTTTPWRLVARYVIGKPLGYNAFVEVDNDLWILTNAGIYPVSLLFSGGSSVAVNGVGRKINPLIQEYGRAFPFNHLWFGRYWPAGKRVYISIPTGTNQSMFAVCNVETGAWCTYEFKTPYPCAMTIHEGEPYLGLSNGQVVLFEDGLDDNGESIDFDMKLPFSYLGARQQFKVFKEIRPLIRSKRGASFSIGVQTDFQDSDSSGTINSTAGTFTAWGSSWGSSWSSITEYIYDWAGVRGQGHSAAIRVQGQMTGVPLEFSHFDLRYELGGQR